MADDDTKKLTRSQSEEQYSGSQKTPSSTKSSPSESNQSLATTESTMISGTPREELIARARSFLTSPQIQHEDVSAKRKFLSDKGLNDSEINGLLQELVSLITHMLIVNPSLNSDIYSPFKHHLFLQELILHPLLQTYLTYSSALPG